jgi:hypothetical protein
MHPCLGSILNVFHKIKYNVFYKYIICYYNSDKYRSVNRLFDVGQREVAFLYLRWLLTREGTLYFLKVNKY